MLNIKLILDITYVGSQVDTNTENSKLLRSKDLKTFNMYNLTATCLLHKEEVTITCYTII